MPRVLVSKSTITGEVKDFAGAVAPEGYLFCRGQAVSRSTFANLFAVIGVAHGQGDGATTFNVPDRQGIFPRGLVSISTVTGSGTAATNNATFTAHGINRTGFKVRLSSGALSGLAVSTDYFIIVVDANTLAFSTTLANAIAGTKIVITGANSAVIIQFEDPDASLRTSSTVGGNSGNTMGAIQQDALQGHWHDVDYGAVAGSAARTNVAALDRLSGATSPSFYIATDLRANATQGTPRSSVETRSKNTLTNYIIKF